MLKKNVLIFSIAYSPLVGGAEIAVKEITDRLGNNFNFHLITNRVSKNLKKEEKIGNVLVFRTGIPYWNENTFARRWSNFLFIIFAFFKALWLNFSFHYKILWPIMASYAGASALFLKILFPRKKLLLTLQEGDAPEHILKRVSKWRYPIWRLLFKLSDHIQVISGFLRDFAVQHGANPSKITIAPNGVDIQKLKITIQNLKSELNIKPEEKIIITTGRLVRKNAVDILIEAFYILNSKFSPFEKSPVGRQAPSFKLLIVGDGLEREALKLQNTKYKIQNNVIFVGFVPPDEVYKYLAISDIFVRPSRSEGLGNSFLEAMAMGVPAIGTPVGGIPDFLKDGETGLFCKVDDPKDLAEKIKILFENNELRERLIKNAKKIVEEKYDWNNISEKMKEIFLSLI